MPLAIEQFDLSAYDIVVSSSHAVAKGVITGPEQFHISYVHSPMRYAWDLQHQYLRESGMSSGIKSMFTRWILHYLRMWDTRTVHGVDSFLANSAYIARRIEKVYGRKARVVYPPVDTTKFTLDAERKKEPFYLAASRMVAYKCMPLIVEAFSKMPDRSLVVIGDGPDMPRVRALAAGKSNIRVLGYQPDEVLLEHMQRAQAFVFAAKEDFGIAPVEAQACGTPVIAYAAGGALETVAGHAGHPGRTGVYFYEQTELAIRQAVDEFKSLSDSAAIDAAVCRRNAERYSEAKFCINFLDAVVEGLDQCANSAR
jgi:glycosyltransferase involved in cell wall biosynthesis